MCNRISYSNADIIAVLVPGVLSVTAAWVRVAKNTIGDYFV